MTTIGIALIVKNEALTLPRLLTPEFMKVFDQVVVVDTGSTDDTVGIARVLGAEVFEFAWVENFAAAREYSFSKLHCEWSGWCDADDQWVGLEHIRGCIEFMEKQADESGQLLHGLWMNYEYDTHDETKKIVAQHQRERFVRMRYGWKWVGRVHEHLVSDFNAQMAFTPDVKVVHNRDKTLDGKRAERNIRLLHLMIKDDPNYARPWYDLGSQFYHGQNWAKAAGYFKKYLAMKPQPIEAYQAMHRLADCYRILNKIDLAAETDRVARDLMPLWRDAYYGLAECAIRQGRFREALAYVEDGRSKHRQEPNKMLVLNPFDYDYHPLLVEHRAYAGLGQVRKAYELLQECKKINPSEPEIAMFEKAYTDFLRDEDATEAAIAIGRVIGEENAESLYYTLPPTVRRKAIVREKMLAPNLLKGTPADVAIWCGQSLDVWGPDTPQTVGIGGSETAVIEVAKRLGERGMNVAIYNLCGEHEGRYGNVRYIDHMRFRPEQPSHLFVGWRNPSVAQLKPTTDQSWLWMHDLNVGPSLREEDALFFDLWRPVSTWHGEHISYLYPFLAGKVHPTRNGVDLARFPLGGEQQRISHRAAWCSSPDRGLEHILVMWPEVRNLIPDAELHIFYGWNNFEKVVQQTQAQQLMSFREKIDELGKAPGVVWRGRVNQDVLATELLKTQVLAYSCAFLEVSGITFMENMAAGSAIVSTVAGAIPETTAGAAALVRGHPNSEAYRKVFVRNVATLMSNAQEHERWAQRGYARAAQLSWDGVVDEWVQRMEETARPSAEDVATQLVETALPQIEVAL